MAQGAGAGQVGAMTLLRTAVLAAATLATGLMAGLFFAYSCSVPGLAATDDRSFVGTLALIGALLARRA